jgi:hypothetical protein
LSRHSQLFHELARLHEPLEQPVHIVLGPAAARARAGFRSKRGITAFGRRHASMMATVHRRWLGLLADPPSPRPLPLDEAQHVAHARDAADHPLRLKGSNSSTLAGARELDRASRDGSRRQGGPARVAVSLLRTMPVMPTRRWNLPRF